MPWLTQALAGLKPSCCRLALPTTLSSEKLSHLQFSAKCWQNLHFSHGCEYHL
jgi:hypothetical protein